jgi:hypothetical protein
MAAEFISYRSQMLENWKNTNLPNCTDKPAQGIGNMEGKTFTHGPLEYHNCKIILDSPATTQALSPELGIADVAFYDCAVFYGGGPVILVPVKVAIEQPPQIIGNIIFKNCLFVLSLSTAPPPDGQNFVIKLLTEPPNDAHFHPSPG